MSAKVKIEPITAIKVCDTYQIMTGLQRYRAARNDGGLPRFYPLGAGLYRVAFTYETKGSKAQ